MDTPRTRARPREAEARQAEAREAKAREAEAREAEVRVCRYLSSGEYIQMSGRAGRRGLDARGTVVTMVDGSTDLAKVREMLRGEADSLSSRFHLSYNMLLNCVRTETANIENLIAKSFYTFQLQQAKPDLERRQRELSAQLASPDLAVDARLLEVHALRAQERSLRKQLRPLLTDPKDTKAVHFLQPGRLVRFAREGGAGEEGEAREWGWGAIVSYKRLRPDKKEGKRGGPA